MGVSVVYTSKLTATETLTNNVPDASSPSVLHNGFDSSFTLNSSSTPAATVMASFNKALSGGAATIDLTALVGTGGGAVSLNGLKVRAIKITAPIGNANPITLVNGASNGHNLTGGAISIVIYPGQEILMYLKDASVAVDGTHKTWDLSGTAAQSLNFEIIGG